MNFANNHAGSRFDIFSNMTIGPAFGLRHRVSKNPLSTQAFDILINAGISTIKVDETTLPGVAKESTNYSAFSLGCGFAYEVGPIQLGVFTGWDFLTGQANQPYVYKNSPYLGFGIGFQIFSFKVAGNKQ